MAETAAEILSAHAAEILFPLGSAIMAETLKMVIFFALIYLFYHEV